MFPYSSTANPVFWLLFLNSTSCWLSAVFSGIKYAFFICFLNKSLSKEERSISFRNSLRSKTPFKLSKTSLYTGSEEWKLPSIIFLLAWLDAFKSIPIISLCGSIISSTVIFPRSKTPIIIFWRSIEVFVIPSEIRVFSWSIESFSSFLSSWDPINLRMILVKKLMKKYSGLNILTIG